MFEKDAGDSDAKHVRVGEVREAEATRRVLLAEDHIPLRPGQSAPRPHAPFQRAPDARANLWMTPPELSKHGNRAQTWGRLQDRHDLGVPYVGERIGPPSPARGLLLRGQARISLDPIPGRL